MWAGGFITWGGFWFVFLQSCVFHPVSQHFSACMFSLKSLVGEYGSKPCVVTSSAWSLTEINT
jgi:maltodextrin utilization protein YvdJ